MQAFLVLLVLLVMAGCGASARASVALPVRPPAAAVAGGVVLHQDGEIFGAVHRVLAAARTRVLVEMYEFDRSDLSAALAGAARAGLDVRLVYDPSVPASARTAAGLARAGLSVRPYPLDDRRHQIDHVKLLLTDSVGLVGGMNWGRTSARNHDYVLETRASPDLGRLLAIFEQDWALAAGHPAPLAAAGPGERVLQTTPGADVRHVLLAMLANARREVQAEAFLLTDPDVEAALVEARRRGARVRVLLDPHQDGNPAALELLRRAGVEARFYPVPAGAKLHAKALRVDGALLVGSANWTLSGLGVNHELDLEVTDAQPVAAYAGRFEKDWARAGSPLPWA